MAVNLVVHEPLSVEWHSVNPDTLPGTWDKYRNLILRALAAGEGSYNERDVLLQILAGAWHLYAYGCPISSICILEFVDYPRQRKCLVRYVAGDGEVLVAAIPTLKAIAGSQGCRVIEAYMRRGWERKLKDWKHKYVISQLEL